MKKKKKKDGSRPALPLLCKLYLWFILPVPQRTSSHDKKFPLSLLRFFFPRQLPAGCCLKPPAPLTVEKGFYALECSSGKAVENCQVCGAPGKSRERRRIDWDKEEMFKDRSGSWDAPLPHPTPVYPHPTPRTAAPGHIFQEFMRVLCIFYGDALLLRYPTMYR